MRADYWIHPDVLYELEALPDVRKLSWAPVAPARLFSGITATSPNGDTAPDEWGYRQLAGNKARIFVDSRTPIDTDAAQEAASLCRMLLAAR